MYVECYIHQQVLLSYHRYSFQSFPVRIAFAQSHSVVVAVALHPEEKYFKEQKYLKKITNETIRKLMQQRNLTSIFSAIDIID